MVTPKNRADNAKECKRVATEAGKSRDGSLSGLTSAQLAELSKANARPRR